MKGVFRKMKVRFVIMLAVALPMMAGAQDAPPPGTNIPQDLDLGIYIQKGSDWQRLLSEAVTFKTGGVLKTVFSEGIVKGDVNGRLQGGRSPNSLPSGSVILIGPLPISTLRAIIVRL